MKDLNSNQFKSDIAVTYNESENICDDEATNISFNFLYNASLLYEKTGSFCFAYLKKKKKTKKTSSFGMEEKRYQQVNIPFIRRTFLILFIAYQELFWFII